VLATSVVAFGLAWWLGLYLVARDPRKPVLRRAGAGLLAYAAALACQSLRTGVTHPALAAALGAAEAVLVCVPAVAWTGVIILLLPDTVRWRQRADQAWRAVLVPLAAIALVPVLAQGGARRGEGLASPAAYLWLVLPVLVPLVVAFAVVLRRWRELRPSPAGGLVGVATLLFGLGLMPLLFPFGWLPRELVLAGMGVDLALLGLAVAVFDAFGEGETLRADMRRSLLGAAGIGALFGSQVSLAMLLGAGHTTPLVALLFGTVAAAIAVQVLGDRTQAAFDLVAFADAPELREARAELRDVADALPRRDDSGLAGLDDGEFARLTRRALSHYGDLGRLVSSPLTGLPAIAERLTARGAPDQPLERATELKALLLESIQRLKPRGGEFGTSDEWRYYNALYYSYVVGIRPYSRRARHDGLSPDARRALEWFARQVPERTLYNWQNAAARIVAADLRAG
jgi:hypothetical protein